VKVAFWATLFPWDRKSARKLAETPNKRKN
jgi:hypothetical protein